MARNLDACIVCGGIDLIPHYRPAKAPGVVKRCARCGFVFIPRVDDGRSIIDERTAERVEDRLRDSRDLGELVGCWEAAELTAKLPEEAALRANALDALAQIGRYVAPPGRLLDFGCGWGFFLDAAREGGWEIHGLEPLPGHALYTRSKVGAEVVTDILRDSTYSPDYFDVITAFQVFEHLPEPAGDLIRLRRALRPGGLLLIEVPNIDTWGVRMMGKRHRHFVPDHLNFFSAETLGRLFASSGLQVVHTYYPTRQMSVGHLVTAWGGRLLPKPVATGLVKTLRPTRLWSRRIHLNLGDIVAVIGRKPE
jgi:2-polyprenyl-3-methyl-5-hydroxy-6-metoxy-1,4-benzoquinol methylase